MKRLLNFLPTHFTVCLIVGIVIQFNYKVWTFSLVPTILVFLIFLCFLFILKFFKKKQLFSVFSWMFFFLIGLYLVFSQDARNNKNFYGNFLIADSIIEVKVKKVLKENRFYHKYITAVTAVGGKVTRGEVLLNVQKDSIKESAKINDIFYFKSNVSSIDSVKNPYQFNYKLYLEKQGVYQQFFLRESSYLYVNSSELSIYKIAENIRTKIERSLVLNGFKGEELGVIKALILGQRSTISKELLNEYTNAGAIHILAVSGLHVGIILLIFSLILKPLEKIKNGIFIKTILIIVMLWCFAVIAGLSASVVRAVTMFTAVAIGMSIKRKTFVIHSLITSMFVLLLVKPLFIFDVGFQLSYLAVFSIVTIQPKLYQIWKPKWKLVDRAWQLFTVSLAAQIGVLPISLFYFHQFPGLFMLSNLVIIPYIGIILMGGILVMLLAILDVLPSLLANLYNIVITLMNDFVGWIALQESFLIKEISFSRSLLITSYIIIFMGISLLERVSFKRWFLFLIAIVSFQVCLLYEKRIVQNTKELIIFNKYRNTIIGINNSGILKINHNLKANEINQSMIIKNYKIGKNIKRVMFKKSIPNILQFKRELILVVDSLGIYKVKNIEKPIVVLVNSPKINLERMITLLNPKLIIADASNYQKQVNKWQLIADKYGVFFKSTRKNGAIVLD